MARLRSLFERCGRLLTYGVALPLICSIAPLTQADASIVSAVNLARRDVCVPGTSTLLVETRGADEIAARLLYGDSLHHALGGLPVRPSFAGSLHLVAVRDERSIAAAVAARFCADLREPGVRELGVAATGRDLWLVALAPLDPPSPGEAPAVARQVLARVNAARAQARRCGSRPYPAVAPLVLSPVLADAAARHSAEMARVGSLAHVGTDGSSPADRARRLGYLPRLVGENIASGVPDADGVVAGWLASPAHCTNIMDARFTEMGVAYAVNGASSGGIYWTQMLGAPRQTVAAND